MNESLIYGIKVDEEKMDKFVEVLLKDNIAIKKEKDGHYDIYEYKFAKMYIDYCHNFGYYKFNYDNYKINDSKYANLKVYQKSNTLNDLKEKIGSDVTIGIETQLKHYNEILNDVSLECVKNNNDKIKTIKSKIGLEIAGNLENRWYDDGIHAKRKIVELEFIPINLGGLKSIENKCGFKVIEKSDGDFRDYKNTNLEFKTETEQRQIRQYVFYFFNKNSREFDIHKKLLNDKKTMVVDENNKIHYREYEPIKKKVIERER